MCNRFSRVQFDGNSSTLESLGYFSVFYVSFDQQRPFDAPFVMFVEVENCSGGFEFVPLGGETCILTTGFTFWPFWLRNTWTNCSLAPC